jgi:hypothetical protein
VGRGAQNASAACGGVRRFGGWPHGRNEFVGKCVGRSGAILDRLAFGSLFDWQGMTDLEAAWPRRGDRVAQRLSGPRGDHVTSPACRSRAFCPQGLRSLSHLTNTEGRLDSRHNSNAGGLKSPPYKQAAETPPFFHTLSVNGCGSIEVSRAVWFGLIA